MGHRAFRLLAQGLTGILEGTAPAIGGARASVRELVEGKRKASAQREEFINGQRMS